MARDVRRVPKQDRARRSVAAILDATAELLGEEHTPVTMSAIGQRAGISKAAIYRYFPDQSAVVHELAARYLEELDQHLASRLNNIGSVDDAVLALSEIIDRFHTLMRDNAAMRRVWLGGPDAVVVSDLVAGAARQSATQIHGALAPFLDGDPSVNLTRIELMVHMARGAVEMAINEPDRAVLGEFKRAIVLSANLLDEGRTAAILESIETASTHGGLALAESPESV